MNAPERSFDEPWQAQLFALTVALNEAGHFTWTEWSSAFGPKVQASEASRYWQVWSDALVELLEQRKLAESAAVAALAQRWQAAAQATPHGKPITLDAAD